MNNYSKWEEFLSTEITDWYNTSIGKIFCNRQEKNRPELPLLSVTGVGGVIDRDTLERRDTSNADKSKYLSVCKGDIVYNTMRMWQGVSGSVPKDGLVSPAYTVLKPNHSITSDYAKHLFKDERLIQIFHKYSQGLVDDTLNLKFENLSSIKVKIPPLTEQQKIASILNSLDKVIETTKKQIDKLLDLKKASINEFMTKGIGHSEFKDSELGRIPKSWKITTLENIGDFTKGKGISKKETTLEGIPCIRYAEIYTEYNYVIDKFKSFILSETKKTTKKLKTNDIIFAGSGETVDEIGKSVAFVSNFDAYVGGDTIIFSPNIECDSVFLSYQLNDDSTRIQLRKFGQGSSVIHVYTSGIKQLKIGLPPIVEQNKITEFLLSYTKTINAKRNKLTQTQSLKKSLMQDLLIGKVRIKKD